MTKKQKLQQEVEDLKKLCSENEKAKNDLQKSLKEATIINEVLKFVIKFPPKYEVGYETDKFVITKIKLPGINFEIKGRSKTGFNVLSFINYAPIVGKALRTGQSVLELIDSINDIEQNKDGKDYAYNVFLKEEKKEASFSELELSEKIKNGEL